MNITEKILIIAVILVASVFLVLVGMIVQDMIHEAVMEHPGPALELLEELIC